MIRLRRDMKPAGRTIVRGLRGVVALVVVVSSGTQLSCDESCECSSSSVRVVGNLLAYPEIPEKATAGVPLEISFRTGGSCVGGGDPIADTEVVYENDGRVAVVTPYDFVREGLVTGDGYSCCLNCPDRGREFEHKANVVFQDPGTARLVVGHRAPGIGPPDDVTTAFVYTVKVASAG